MSSKLLQLSLYVVTVIQLMSSQPTHDVIRRENDVNSWEHNDQVLSELVSAVSLLQTAMSQLQTTVLQSQTTVSQLQSTNSELQRDVAKIKAAGGGKK